MNDKAFTYANQPNQRFKSTASCLLDNSSSSSIARLEIKSSYSFSAEEVNARFQSLRRRACSLWSGVAMSAVTAELSVRPSQSANRIRQTLITKYSHIQNERYLHGPLGSPLLPMRGMIAAGSRNDTSLGPASQVRSCGVASHTGLCTYQRAQHLHIVHAISRYRCVACRWQQPTPSRAWKS